MVEKNLSTFLETFLSNHIDINLTKGYNAGVNRICHYERRTEMLKVKNLREAKGMTQSDLAKASGVSRATISAIENGKETVMTKSLLAIAKALDTTVDNFFA